MWIHFIGNHTIYILCSMPTCFWADKRWKIKKKKPPNDIILSVHIGSGILCVILCSRRASTVVGIRLSADEIIHGYNSVAMTCMLHTSYDIIKTVTIRLCDFCDLTRSGRPRAFNSGPQTGQSDTMNYAICYSPVCTHNMRGSNRRRISLQVLKCTLRIFCTCFKSS